MKEEEKRFPWLCLPNPNSTEQPIANPKIQRKPFHFTPLYLNNFIVCRWLKSKSKLGYHSTHHLSIHPWVIHSLVGVQDEDTGALNSKTVAETACIIMIVNKYRLLSFFITCCRHGEWERTGWSLFMLARFFRWEMVSYSEKWIKCPQPKKKELNTPNPLIDWQMLARRSKFFLFFLNFFFDNVNAGNKDLSIRVSIAWRKENYIVFFLRRLYLLDRVACVSVFCTTEKIRWRQ